MDLAAQHVELRAEILEAVEDVIRQGAFIGGRPVESFEREWAEFCGVHHAVAVGNGTDALRLALMAAGIGPGDEVLTVSNTFVATVEAVLQAGARPVLVDVDPLTGTIDPGRLLAGITKQCRAVLPVHLYGNLAEMDQIRTVAEAHRLMVIEDAAQAHGAEYLGKRAGSLGTVAAFSFYPTKNLGAGGDAGAVTTDDPDLAERVRMLRDHGQRVKNRHEREGFNSRMDAIQAAILRVKLKKLSFWNDRRRALAEIYHRELSGIPGLSLPDSTPGARAVYHLYVVRSWARDALKQGLEQAGVGSAIHYPVPVHLQPGFSHLGYGPGSLPVTESLAQQVLSLPLYPELDPEDVGAVCARIRAILS